MNNLALNVIHYQAVRARVRAEETDIDERTLADTVEGLTDFHEIVAAIVRSAIVDEALASGLKERIKAMQERLERFEDRASKRRQIARDVMGETEIKKITAPDFTVSLRPGTPSLGVVDEAAIPEGFWEPQAPLLNRQTPLAELKQGDSIAGVALSNPQAVLSVRTR